MNVYENCPVLENPRWLMRLVEKSDAEDLLEVYSDKRALPYFNSDNCDGDNFYYPTIDRMNDALDFWIQSYETEWFVRWAIIDKTLSKAIGTIEAFHRPYREDFGEVGVIRLDVGSEYEKADILKEILELFVPKAYEFFDCSEIITKIPNYAVERAEAAESIGFERTDKCLVGDDGYAYNGYWTITKGSQA